MPDGLVGSITDIRKFSTHDGPGIRTTIFLKGCPLRCNWCSNPETQKAYPELYFIPKRCNTFGACVDICPEGAINIENKSIIDRSKCNRCMKCTRACPHGAYKEIGRKASVGEVMVECEKDLPFYQSDGGITISGGEPLYQPDFTIALFQACREKQLSTVLDTSGYGDAVVVEKVLPLTDLVLLDIKHMDSDKHMEGTGVPNEVILQNARLMAQKVRIRVSLPLIPDFNNSQDNLEKTALFSRSIGAESVDINPIHALGAHKYQYLGLPSPYVAYKEITREDIKKAQEIFQSEGMTTTIGRMM